MHGWHCYISKTYPPDKLSKLRTTGPWLLTDLFTRTISKHSGILVTYMHLRIVSQSIQRGLIDVILGYGRLDVSDRGFKCIRIIGVKKQNLVYF